MSKLMTLKDKIELIIIGVTLFLIYFIGGDSYIAKLLIVVVTIAYMIYLYKVLLSEIYKDCHSEESILKSASIKQYRRKD